MTNFFDLDRPRITGSERFTVSPAAGGGLFPFASAMSRLLVKRLRRVVHASDQAPRKRRVRERVPRGDTKDSMG